MLGLASPGVTTDESGDYRRVGRRKRQDVAAARAWDTSWWKRLPYSGIAALLGVVLLTLLSLGVLFASDGAPIDEWSILNTKFQPQVWVAVLSVLSNALLAYAFVEGVAILFWRKAISGTTLQYLHDSYESMALTSAVAVLFRRHFNVVAFACLMVTLSLVRGPLFQRASTVTTASRELKGVTTLRVAQIIPHGYTTHYRDEDGLQVSMSPEFKDVILNMTSTLPIPYPNTGCPGRCRARVKAAGWRVNCTATSTAWGISDAERAARAARLRCAVYNRIGMTATPTVAADPTAALTPGDLQASAIAAAAGENIRDCRYHDNVGDTDVFRTGFFRGRRNLTLHTLAKNFTGCGSSDGGNRSSSSTNATRPRIVSRACTLTLGIVDYAVELTPHSVALLHPQQLPPTVAAAAAAAGGADIDGGGDDDDRYLGDAGTVEAYYTATYAYLMLFPPVRVYLQWRMSRATPVPQRRTSCPGAGTFVTNVTCLENPEEAKIRDTSLMFMTRRPPASAPSALKDRCELTWRDPMEDMLRTMRELAFRASVDAARYANRTIFQAPLVPEDPRLHAQHTANWTQRVAYAGAQPRTVFRTDWRFAGAAAAASLVCGVALGVLPLFWGWWQLGRAVSLNPLELARAFRAPLLSRTTVRSNADRAALVRASGAMRVRYGAVEVVDDGAGNGGEKKAGEEQGEGQAASGAQGSLLLSLPPLPALQPLLGDAWDDVAAVPAAAPAAAAPAVAASTKKYVLCFEIDDADACGHDVGGGGSSGHHHTRRRVAKPEPGAIYD